MGLFSSCVFVPFEPSWLMRLCSRGCGSFQHFAREGSVCLSTARFHVVENHRHSMTRRFTEANVSRDHRPKYFFLEELPHVGRDLLTEIGALVEHREQDAV